MVWFLIFYVSDLYKVLFYVKIVLELGVFFLNVFCFFVFIIVFLFVVNSVIKCVNIVIWYYKKI